MLGVLFKMQTAFGDELQHDFPECIGIGNVKDIIGQLVLIKREYVICEYICTLGINEAGLVVLFAVLSDHEHFN